MNKLKKAKLIRLEMMKNVTSKIFPQFPSPMVKDVKLCCCDSKEEIFPLESHSMKLSIKRGRGELNLREMLGSKVRGAFKSVPSN